MFNNLPAIRRVIPHPILRLIPILGTRGPSRELVQTTIQYGHLSHRSR
jgi:hypothetical protein